MLLPSLRTLSSSLKSSVGGISPDRRSFLDTVAAAIRKGVVAGELHLNFICTHNSRRSMLSQAWAQAAAHHHGIRGIFSVSGGTEVTAFHPNAVEALRRQGFEIAMGSDGNNPRYALRYSSEAAPLEMFSKRFDAAVPEGKPFLAMMVCSTADSQCPFVPGAIGRFQFNYSDPGKADGTPMERAAYDERSSEIAREMLYVFGKVTTG